MPKSVATAVHELLEISRPADEETPGAPAPSVFSEEEKQATIARLEESMLDAAEHLDFEKAAKLRDQLLALRGDAPMVNAEKSRKKRRTREKMTHRHSQ